MSQTLRICKRSLGGLLGSPMGYIILTLFLLCSGFFFYHIVLERAVSLQSLRVGGNAPATVCREYWRTLGWIILFVVPIISMGMIAGEKNRGTMELLLTSPLSFTQLVVGKYMALFAFLTVMFLPTLVYFAYLRTFGGIAYGQIAAGYLGGFLLGAATLSVGLLISALTRNQIIAAFGTFGCILIFWFIDAAGNNVPGFWRNVIRYFSLNVHYKDIVQANIGLHNITFFLSFTAACLFTAHLAIRILWVKGKWN
jgi:ABC-2 type transport system permease protein